MSALAEVTVFQPRPMTWADVMADRIARGLEGSPTVIMRAPRAPAPRKLRKTMDAAIEAWGSPNDPRLPSNVKPCTAPLATSKAKTAAQAAKSRKLAMGACLCRLCALALRPPLTFAEQALYVGKVCDEYQERLIFGAPRVLREHVASKEAREAHKSSLAESHSPFRG